MTQATPARAWSFNSALRLLPNDRVARKALQRQHCDTTVTRRHLSSSARAILSTELIQPRTVGQDPVFTARYRMAVRTDIDCQVAFQRGCGLKMITTARARDIQRSIRRMTTIHLHKHTPAQAPKGLISDSFKHYYVHIHSNVSSHNASASSSSPSSVIELIFNADSRNN